MKRAIFVLLTLSLLLTATVPAVYATETTDSTEAATEETVDPSRCGADLTWSLDGGVLTISGTGAMDDMSGGAPWAEHKDKITSVVLTGGVTTVGAYAFQDYDSITTVDFGDSLKEIDTQAFENCDGLTEIYLPATFRRFGRSCFQDCDSLTKVHCAGSMPSFNANCLWNGKSVTVYCPVNNPWPETYVEELETNFGGRLQILAEDGADPFDFTEPEETTQETTEATEETVEETTEVTEETESTTEATTAPATEEETVPTETEAPTEETAEATEPTVPEEREVRGAVVIALAVMVLSALGIVVVLVLLRKNRGGKYAA